MHRSEIENHTELCRKAELYDAFSIMLQEASSRGNSREATYVISGVLENLSRDYSELKKLSQNWTDLANLESKMKGAA